MKRYLIFSLLLLAVTAAAWGQPADSLDPAPAVDTAGVAAGMTEARDGEASTPEALWDAANTAYINGRYDAAIEGYQQILSRGLYSAKLYYNLANASFKAGRTGRAILFYHRALRLDPGNEDIRYNLQVAEKSTKDHIEAVPEFFLRSWMRALRHTLSGTAWSVLSLLSLAAMLALVLFYLLARRIALRKTGFYGMLAALCLFAVTTAFAVAQRRELTDARTAIVMAASASVKSSPDGGATDLFVLHEGTPVKITGSLGDWREIVIADGNKGWIEAARIETI
jgi:hypothetical protein